MIDTSKLRTMLETAARTGRAPDDDAVGDLLRARVATSTEYHRRHRDLMKLGREVASHSRGGNLRMVDQLVEGAVIEYGGVPDVSAITRTGGTVTNNRGQRLGAREVQHIEPLRMALRAAAGAGQPLTRRDVERLHTNLDGQAFDTFMAEVIEASREIARIQRTGEQAEARRMADQVARELGQHMVPVPQHPDTDDLTDPRELAALIPRRPGDQYR